MFGVDYDWRSEMKETKLDEVDCVTEVTQPTEYRFRSGTGDTYVARKQHSNIWTMGPEGDETQAVMAGLIESRRPDDAKRIGVEWQQPRPPLSLTTVMLGELYVSSREVAYAWSDSAEWSFALAIARRFEIDAVFPVGVEIGRTRVLRKGDN